MIHDRAHLTEEIKRLFIFEVERCDFCVIYSVHNARWCRHPFKLGLSEASPLDNQPQRGFDRYHSLGHHRLLYKLSFIF